MCLRQDQAWKPGMSGLVERDDPRDPFLSQPLEVERVFHAIDALVRQWRALTLLLMP